MEANRIILYLEQSILKSKIIYIKKRINVIPPKINTYF